MTSSKLSREDTMRYYPYFANAFVLNNTPLHAVRNAIEYSGRQQPSSASGAATIGIMHREIRVQPLINADHR
jgi:hypothetical protein